MQKTYKITLLVVGIFFLSFSCFAQVADEEVPPRYPEQSLFGAIKSFFKEGEVNCLFSLFQGYDNNVYLNSQRKRDAFTQMFFKSNLTSPINEQLEGILGYELMSLMYADASDVNLIRTGLRLGLDYKINTDLNFLTDYRFGVADYINSGEDDFLDHRIKFKLKRIFLSKLYHSLSYELMFKDYRQRKTRTTPVTYSSKTREDFRRTIEYELGHYFPKDLFKIKFQYYLNDSNERYLDYYDYDSYRVIFSLTHLFNDKLFGYLSFSRQLREYSSRTLSVPIGSISLERDKTSVITSALYYNLNKTFTLGLNYTYRQNWSNEPTGRYSGSIISLGAYCKF